MKISDTVGDSIYFDENCGKLYDWGASPSHKLDICGEVEIGVGTCVPTDKIDLLINDNHYISKDIIRWADGDIDLSPEEMKTAVQYLSMAIKETILKEKP